jgi:hypothetical protein
MHHVSSIAQPTTSPGVFETEVLMRRGHRERHQLLQLLGKVNKGVVLLWQGEGTQMLFDERAAAILLLHWKHAKQLYSARHIVLSDGACGD